MSIRPPACPGGAGPGTSADLHRLLCAARATAPRHAMAAAPGGGVSSSYAQQVYPTTLYPDPRAPTPRAAARWCGETATAAAPGRSRLYEIRHNYVVHTGSDPAAPPSSAGCAAL